MAENVSKQGSRIGRTYLGISSQITVATLRLSSQGIDNWRMAIDNARSELNPRRRLLYELYENIMLDGHLLSVAEKRRIAISNKKIRFIDKAGKQNDIVNDKICNTPWFFDLIEHAMDSVTWGHSLIELIPIKGEIGAVELIPRMNVSPERKTVFWNYTNEEDGFNYLNDKQYSKYMIEVANKERFGKLISAAQYVIYKRGGFGDWAQFAELFGMPFRVGKYNPFDDHSRQLLNKGLAEMGGAAHATIPEGTSIEFHDSNGTGKSEVFKDLISVCNEELSKLFLGNTMTTDNGSSRSQSDTHQEQQDDISLSDMTRTEYLLNWSFKNKMIALGYPQEGHYKFPELNEIPLDKRIELDVKVAEQVEVPDEYWYETYGIPAPKSSSVKADPIEEEDNDDPASEAGGKTEETPEPKQKPKKAVKLKASIAHCYKPACGHKHFRHLPPEAKKPSPELDKLFEDLMADVHAKKYKPGEFPVDYVQEVAKKLLNAFTGGFKPDFTNKQDSDFVLTIKQNIWPFSAAKSFAQMKLMRNELLDDKGAVRSFQDFQKRVADIGVAFNGNYLMAEYNLAVSSGQMASQWKNFEAAKDTRPNLKFQTAGDERVRDSHAVLDGVIAPIDSEFWNKNWPPLAWNCRCDAVNTSAEANDPETLNKKSAQADVKPLFQNNVGKTAVVYSEQHPYFQALSKAENTAIEKLRNSIKDI